MGVRGWLAVGVGVLVAGWSAPALARWAPRQHRPARVVRLDQRAAHAAAVSRTVLVSPDGAPVTTIEQRWARSMRVSSWAGRLILSRDVTPCQRWTGEYIPACAEVGEIAFAAGTSRYVLYHELGHEFDARYLTGRDHRILIRWLSQDIGGGLRFWWNPNEQTHEAEAFAGAEYFADAFADCASADRTNEDQRVCLYVDAAAVRAGS